MAGKLKVTCYNSLPASGWDNALSSEVGDVLGACNDWKAFVLQS